MYRWCIRPILFRCDPEWIHERTLALGQFLGRFATTRKTLDRLYTFCDPRLRTTVAGLKFENPVGLAAGFDKNGRPRARRRARGGGLRPAVGRSVVQAGRERTPDRYSELVRRYYESLADGQKPRDDRHRRGSLR